ncbi:protein FAM171A1 [Tachyglossus aculeatus]|uniref:protein FAM171A1 n=1 Tax=Tachyglossus aculeatus TaxID=9261 RepID=UPI0018F3A6D9|nr:protein FAM171A1 [Tachyglossus aculeatus]
MGEVHGLIRELAPFLASASNKKKFHLFMLDPEEGSLHRILIQDWDISDLSTLTPSRRDPLEGEKAGADTEQNYLLGKLRRRCGGRRPSWRWRPWGAWGAWAAWGGWAAGGVRGPGNGDKPPRRAPRDARPLPEVTLKVHVSDGSTHQPILEAFVEIFTNQVSVASGSTGADGIAFIKFQYKLGSQLVVTASKHAYVPGSAPWKPTRLPVFSSLSLRLLPERSATLMVYEDVVQVLAAFQGTRPEPHAHFPRRALKLPEDAGYGNLTAFLTAASSPVEARSFPYLQGLDGNGTGNSTSYDLTPVTAISVQLLNSDGAPVAVEGPIFVTVPLPIYSNLKHNAYVTAWRFDPKLGTWLKSGLGLVQQEGTQLTWTYIAPQLGYWVAAMSPDGQGPVVTQDIATYHTVFLLAILGGLAFILLVLLGLALYYCRRKCLKPRQHPRKPQLPASLDAAKKDQSTSMSHVNLLFSHRESDFPGALPAATGGRPDLSGREELMAGAGLETISAGGNPGPPTPRLKLSYSTSQEFSSREELLSRRDEDRGRASFDHLAPGGAFGKDYHRSVEIFPLRSRKAPEAEGREDDYRKSYDVLVPPARPLPAGGRPRTPARPGPGPSSSPEKEQPAERRPAECMMSRSVDHLERPAAAYPRPGQLLCCNSVDQVSDRLFRSVVPTLAVPARYLQLPGEPPYGGQPWEEEPGEMERLQAELAGSHTQLFRPPHFSAQAVSQQHLQEAGAGDWSAPDAPVAESLSIPAALNDAALVHVAAGDGPLLVEKALMELGGGRPLPHPRAWFVSLDGRSNAHVRHSYIDLQRAGRGGRNDASLDSGVDMNEPRAARKGRGDPPTLPSPQGPGEPPPGEPAFPRLVDLDGPEREGGEAEGPEDGALRCFLEAAGRRAGAQLPSLQEEAGKRAADRPPEPPAGPDPGPTAREGDDDDDDDDQGEDKKSPWQRREERPLMAFNLK